MDQLPRLGKLICLLLFTCNNVVSGRRGFLFLWVLGMGYVILLRHSPSLPYISLIIQRAKSNYISTSTPLNSSQDRSIANGAKLINLLPENPSFCRSDKLVRDLFETNETVYKFMCTKINNKGMKQYVLGLI